MIDAVQENVIEWLNGDEEATCTFSQGRYINRVKKLAEKYPDRVKIMVQNKDGSILVKLPLKALHLTIHEKSNGGNLPLPDTKNSQEKKKG